MFDLEENVTFFVMFDLEENDSFFVMFDFTFDLEEN